MAKLGIKKFKKIAENNDKKIEIFGKNKLLMEGCRRIVYYDDKSIILKGEFPVKITGENLVLKQLGNDNVCAEGHIFHISFDDSSL